MLKSSKFLDPQTLKQALSNSLDHTFKHTFSTHSNTLKHSLFHLHTESHAFIPNTFFRPPLTRSFSNLRPFYSSIFSYFKAIFGWPFLLNRFRWKLKNFQLDNLMMLNPKVEVLKPSTGSLTPFGVENGTILD